MTAVNDAPVVHDFTLPTREDTPVEFDLHDVAYDAETPVEQLTFSFLDSEAGTIEVLPGGNARFTPHPDFNGELDMWFSVTDPEGGETWSYIMVNVAPVNDAPIAVDGWLWAQQDAAVEFDLLEFVVDIDTPSEQLSFDVCTCCGGTVELLADGHTVLFTPETDFAGEIEVLFHVTDEDEDDWANITLEFESTCAADAVFAEFGECA